MDWLKWIAGAGLLIAVIWLLASIGKGADEVSKQHPAEGDHE